VIAPPALRQGNLAALALQGVEKRWPRMPSPVLDGVDMEVEPGTLVFLGGENGAGKTTLLRIAAGLFAPDRGVVRVKGLDPVRDRRRYLGKIGFVPAGTSGLYARLSVAAHLRLWARLALVPRATSGAAIEATSERFGLGDLLGRRVDRLSMGQRQRLRLALGFLHAPDLVLLDEPLASLDEAGTGLLQAALDAHAAGGGSALWCAPSPSGACFDRAYRLERGQLLPA
jgi:ABC-type multidrug transport system ATPase subunit